MSGLFPTYARWEVEPSKAVGSYLYDKNDKKYLDFTSGIGVCNLGHQPEVVKKAVQIQLDQFWHVSNLFPQEKQREEQKLLLFNSPFMEGRLQQCQRLVKTR